MRRYGFTLIEILIVIVILGILSGIAIPYFAGAKKRAFLVACKTNLKNISDALSLYNNDLDINGTLSNYVLNDENNFLKQNGYIDNTLKCPVSDSYYILNYTNDMNYTILCPFPTEHYRFPIRQCKKVAYSISNGFIIQ